MVWLALVGLTVVGGETMRVFTLVMIFGVVIGTYSSIYVAAPVLMVWPPKRGGEPPRKSNLVEGEEELA